MDIYSTYYMLAAVEELRPEHTFFRDRYFPTDAAMDVFGTSKVLADYRESTQKRAPFVMPKIGSLPVGRDGFKTYELEPPYISISMPLTLDQLKNRGFGESLLSEATPEQRARTLLMSDLAELSARISRTEEWMACQTMLNNGCTMRHETDQKDEYEDVAVKFYDGNKNPALFTPSAEWTHSKKDENGTLVPGSWYSDVCKMVSLLKRRGMPATDLLVSNDVGEFLMEDEWILYMLDNRRAEMGALEPAELTEYVTQLGRFNFKGRSLNILVNDGTFDENGVDTPYLDDGSVIVTAPGVGRCLYGAVDQLEHDGEFHTYAGKRVPQHLFTIQPPVKETRLTSRPLMVPKRQNPWTVAKKVLG